MISEAARQAEEEFQSFKKTIELFRSPGNKLYSEE